MRKNFWLARIFRNETEQRLRAGWRIVGFLLLFMALNALVSVVLRFTVGTARDPTVRTLALGVLLVCTATAAVFLSRRYLDRKTLVSLGLSRRWAVRDLAFGFVLSGLMVGLAFSLMLIMGYLDVKSARLPGSADGLLQLALLLFGVGILVGWWEEIVFRGYLLQNLRDGMGLSGAVLLSCMLYGLIHMLNPNAGVLSGVLIALIGLLRIYGWLSTGQLWLSMGMHAGWNFFQGPIFGFPVSGRETPALLGLEVSGPACITGGAFGPEAGLICLPALVIGWSAMAAWAKWSRKSAPAAN